MERTAGCPFTEDEVTAEGPSVPTPAPSSTGGTGFTITVTPEYPIISTAAISALHARVNVHFTEQAANLTRSSALDVVCILDNSGSMDGSKLRHLQAAMRFIVSVLSVKDRLAVVTFNSTASVVHGLKCMTSAAKTASREAIQRIDANGGTDIHAGMQTGWEVLQRRRTRNAVSCVFLLTDGQDQSNLEEKRALARSIRAAGCSLFLFGFGADHDSEHMNAIANAAEGSFIYIADDDAVVEAFGGAIGTQQGAILRDVRITLRAPEGVRIDAVRAGRYPCTSTSSEAVVRFADLYGGEQRDFLVSLAVPAVSVAIAEYAILSAEGVYKHIGDNNDRIVPAQSAVVRRLLPADLAKLRPQPLRDEGVDSQLMRLQCTDAMEQALQAADRQDIAEARRLLANARGALLESVSHQQRLPVAAELLRELDDALRHVASANEYGRHGGRAAIQESCTAYGMQRAAYNKKDNCSNMYQNSASVSMQSKAKASKGFF